MSSRSTSGRYVTAQGYVRAKTALGWRLEHIVVVERALGRCLPEGAIVHHADGDKTNNATSNLVVCPDRAYHNLLEKRIRAFKATGHPDWRFCQYCRKWDAPENLYISPIRGGQAHHRACACEIRKQERDADINGYRETRRLRYAARRGESYKPKLRCRKPAA